MKKILWVFSVLCVVIPGVVVWMAWTNQMTFREGLETATKWYLTIVLFIVSFVVNYIAWSNFLRHKKKWGKNEKRQN